MNAKRLIEKKRKEKKRKEKKRKDYAFRRQFNEKPSIIPGCPGKRLILVLADKAGSRISWADMVCCKSDVSAMSCGGSTNS